MVDRYGLRLYPTDDVMSDHVGRCRPDDAPLLREFAAMEMDERWVTRSPETMLETFHWFQGEGFPHIIDDLLHLPAEPGVVVEGFRLLPRLVMPYLAARDQAVWLIPTPGFRRAAFAGRGTLWDIPRRTVAPQRALHNLLERDRLFTERLQDEARRLGLRVIEVDTTMNEDDLTERVARAFGLRAR